MPDSSPWSNQSINQLIVNEETEGISGFFGYSPAQGSGNLVFSVSAASGTDSSGNPYPAGMALTNTPAVWYLDSSGSGVQVVQVASLTTSGSTMSGSFANAVTSGNCVCAVFSVSGNTTIPSAPLFNSVSMTEGYFFDDWNGSDTDAVYSCYLADITTGGKAFSCALGASSVTAITGGMMAEVSGLGSAPVASTAGSQNGAAAAAAGTSSSFSSGGLAPAGSAPSFYLGILAGHGVISGTVSGWTQAGLNSHSGYLEGSGEQAFAGNLTAKAVWLAAVYSFTSSSAMAPSAIEVSISPDATVDSVTGSTIPAGIYASTITVGATTGTGTVGGPGYGIVTSNFLKLTEGASDPPGPGTPIGSYCYIWYQAGDLLAVGASGTIILLGST